MSFVWSLAVGVSAKCARGVFLLLGHLRGLVAGDRGVVQLHSAGRAVGVLDEQQKQHGNLLFGPWSAAS